MRAFIAPPGSAFPSGNLAIGIGIFTERNFVATTYYCNYCIFCMSPKKKPLELDSPRTNDEESMNSNLNSDHGLLGGNSPIHTRENRQPSSEDLLPDEIDMTVITRAEEKSIRSDAKQQLKTHVQEYIDNMSLSYVLGLACVLGLGNAGDAVEISKVGFFLPDMPDISVLQASLLTSAVFLGMFFGGTLLGQVSDQFGRRRTIIATLAVNGLASLACATFPKLEAVIFFRFAGGVTIGGSFPVIFTYGAELFPSRLRGRVITIIGSFFMVGAVYVAVVAMLTLPGAQAAGTTLTPQLRFYVILTTIPVLTACLFSYLYLPESPLFLLRKHKYKELLSVLNKHYGATELELRRLTKYISDLNTHRRYEGSSISGQGAEKGYLTDSFKNFHVLWNSPPLRKQAVLLIIIYATLAYSSYGITTWISQLYLEVGISNEYFAALIFTAAQVPANIISIMFIEKLGRKKLLVAGLGVGCLATCICAFDYEKQTLVIMLTSIFNMATVVAWNSLNCFSVESFPTRIRSSTMGILGAMGRVSAAIAQFSNASMQSNVELLLLVTAFTLLVGTSSALCITETAGNELPEEEESPRSPSSSSGSSSGGGGGTNEERTLVARNPISKF